jgi:hypothetical protein
MIWDILRSQEPYRKDQSAPDSRTETPCVTPLRRALRVAPEEKLQRARQQTHACEPPVSEVPGESHGDAWKHIILTLAALALGLIAMIACLGWLLGTQRSATS